MPAALQSWSWTQSAPLSLPLSVSWAAPLLPCFLLSTLSDSSGLSVFTYPVSRPAWTAAISLRVSSEYKPIGELYCLLWAGLTATLAPEESAPTGPEEALQANRPLTCSAWGFRWSRRGEETEPERSRECWVTAINITFCCKCWINILSIF